ncbi:unnamed protein product [Musa hybrid cultivar]
MFWPWDFLPSSAIKRAFRSLLQKNLGDVILGDIDLDQLDVRLATGTICLSDLALDVDFLNQKIVGAPVMVKEGSIKSLSIKIPWKLTQNIEIELDELELVFGQSSGSNITLPDCSPSGYDVEQHSTNVEKLKLGNLENCYSYGYVHEGVKAIADTVKKCLTRFHGRINSVTVGFDLQSAFDELLVLRIKEIEFETYVSEDSMSKVVSYLKFQEANVEFLQMNYIDESTEPHKHRGRSFNKRVLQNGAIPILTGPNGGFSGTIKLSIPCENGSLDIHKVNADVSIDSVELRVQPNIIEWATYAWQSLNIGASHCQENQSEVNSDYNGSVDQFDECSNGMRSSQAYSERVDTTLQAALGNVSVILFLNNDDQKLPRGPNNFFDPLVSELNSESYMTCQSSSDVFSATEVNHHNKKMRHLESKCQDIIFNLKTCSQDAKFSASVKHVNLDAYYDTQKYAVGFSSNDCKNISSEQIFSSHYLQEKVHGSLPTFPFQIQYHGLESALEDNTLNGLTHVRLLESFGECSCTFSVNSKDQKDPVTDSCMADRVWSLASSHERNRNKVIGEGFNFSTISHMEDLEKSNFKIRQELILNSALCLHIKLCSLWINLDDHDYKILYCLLNNVTDGCSKAANGMDSSIDNDINNEQMSLSSYNASQISILLDCDTINACIRFNELVEVAQPLQKELQGSWVCFKLKLNKFESLSVLSIDGITNGKFLWLNHGEGDLWGSKINRDRDESELLLITCRSSAMSRGNGEGSNVFFGPAGTAVTHTWNPESQQSYTSVIACCWTVIAPSAQLDWINTLYLYFSSSLREKESLVNDRTASKESFFLDLMDVGLSYEPQNKQSPVSSEDWDFVNFCDVEPDNEPDKMYTACFLAASSLSLSTHFRSDLAMDYHIHTRDVGLLISESIGSMHDIDGYSVAYLKKYGYTKIAQVSLLQSILRIRGLYWEIECAESHIDLESCCDTTYGLIQLIAQLQQLYAPHVEDVLMHSESSWNTIQQAGKEQNSGYMADISSSNSIVSGSGSSTGNEDCQASGLLDDIVENAFECHAMSDYCNIQSHNLLEQYKLGNISKSKVNVRDSDSSYISEMGNLLNQSVNKTWIDDGLMIIEDYFSINLPEGKFLPDNTYAADCPAKGRILLRNMDARWRLYDGHDWIKSNGVSMCSVISNGRDRNVCLELSLSGLHLQYDMYPEGKTNASTLSLSVQDFYLFDTSRDAPWKMGNAGMPPWLYLELLPLRLHLDQAHINFLMSFFNQGPFDDFSPGSSNALDESVMSKIVEALSPFIQAKCCEVRPVVIHVDYTPRHFNPAALGRGNYVELLNLVPWKGVELQLKHVCATGVHGWSSVCETVLGIWLEDVAHSQVPNILKGITPANSLFSVCSGFSKLVMLPVKSYKNDCKLLKGMKRGAFAFVKSISIEAARLGVHLAAGTNDILLQAEDILKSAPKSETESKKANVRYNQPENVHEGIQQAYENLSDGFGRTISALVGTPLKVFQRGAGTGSALTTAVHAVPAAAIYPLSYSARAVYSTLLGLRNSMDPDHKRESMEKYRGPSPITRSPN